jgi:hypothetical protein
VFWVIAAILFVLWVLGMVSGATQGAWIHLFLLLAGACAAVAATSAAMKQRSLRDGPRSLL